MPDDLLERPYPLRLTDLDAWSVAHGTTSDEARRRFIQFVILQALSAGDIARRLAFKGGNALRFGYGFSRSTFDLDFTSVDLLENSDYIRTVIDTTVRTEAQDFNVKCKVSSVKRNPSNLDRTLPTYTVKIGYAFPGDRVFPDFLETDRMASTVVPLDITFNDVICETILLSFTDDTSHELTICTLNDIVAEKLRAILQQGIRNRHRPQDVFDIARIIRNNRDELDLERIRDYVDAKCHARNVVFSVESFNDDIRNRSLYGYDELSTDLPDEFIPFESAWLEVVSFVRELCG